MAEEKENIIILKKIISHGGHHGGAWKVAYADFVTAMMALFMVLWLLSSSSEVKKAVGGYFNDPTGNGKQMSSDLSGAGGNSISVNEDDMAKLKEKINAAMKTMPNFKEFKDNVTMIVTGEGLRVELVEKEQGMFFDSGKPSPSESGKELIAKLALQIASLPNKVFIEGHTDAKQFAGDYSNWELSAERANAARKVMMSNGMRPDQVAQIRGFADQNLRIPNDPDNPGNRRVSIIIQYVALPAEPSEHKVEEPESAEQGNATEGGQKTQEAATAEKPSEDGQKKQAAAKPKRKKGGH